MGEKAKIFKARSLHGNRSCRCRGHQRGGQCALPGEVSVGAIKLVRSQDRDEAGGEVSRGHRRSLDPTEGPNRRGGKETQPS